MPSGKPTSMGFSERLLNLTFDGTLISNMSFETLPSQDAGPRSVVAARVVKRTIVDIKFKTRHPVPSHAGICKPAAPAMESVWEAEA
jgi:hypothetical protein